MLKMMSCHPCFKIKFELVMLSRWARISLP
jgi:hypothetical protein